MSNEVHGVTNIVKVGEPFVFKAYNYSYFIFRVLDDEYYYVRKNGLFGIVQYNIPSKTMTERVPCEYPVFGDAYKKLCEDPGFLEKISGRYQSTFDGTIGDLPKGARK